MPLLSEWLLTHYLVIASLMLCLMSCLMDRDTVIPDPYYILLKVERGGGDSNTDTDTDMEYRD